MMPNRRWILPAAAAGRDGWPSYLGRWWDCWCWVCSGVVHECVGACRTREGTREYCWSGEVRRVMVCIGASGGVV